MKIILIITAMLGVGIMVKFFRILSAITIVLEKSNNELETIISNL